MFVLLMSAKLCKIQPPPFISGVILRPGFIYGDRQVGSIKVPLGVLGGPLEMVMKFFL